MTTHQAKLQRLWSLTLALFVILIACGHIGAQEITFLALNRPGQGSIAIDHQKHTAYITDLGKAGDGNKAFLDQKPLLDRLAELGVSNLVFTCSHPHSDHMGGIRALFEQPSVFFTDESRTVARFDSITVIDDEMPKGESLFNILTQSLGKNTLLRTRHISAQNHNVFADISHEGDDIFIENIPYSAREGASGHGRSVVTHVVLGGNYSTVDFDDADSEVVHDSISKLSSKRIDSFVVPHHGSAFHDIAPILALEPKPTSAIIAVNARNPYGHPAPEILLQLMNSLGPGNVYFTGSVDQVTVTPNGIQHARYSAADMESYTLFIEPGYERAKARNDSRRMALYEQVRTRMEAASTAKANNGNPPGPTPEQVAQDEINARLESAEQNADDILALSDKLALSTTALPAEKRKLNEIRSMQRESLQSLIASITSYESQYGSSMRDERDRLSVLFIKTPDDPPGTQAKRAPASPNNGPSGPQEPPASPNNGPSGLQEHINRTVEDVSATSPVPVLSNRNVDDVRFVASLDSVQAAAPIIQAWDRRITEQVPPQLAVPFSAVLNPTSTKQRPGGISIGNVASEALNLDLRNYLLTYDPARQLLLFDGPNGSQIFYPHRIEPDALKSLYRYAASGRNAAVSMSLAKSGALNRVIRLDPVFVDTIVGRDLIATDLIGWELANEKLPDGRVNPFASTFQSEVQAAFRCSSDGLLYSDLIDQPTSITRTGTTLVLKGHMGFQYMADLPSTTVCSFAKCNSAINGKRACHFLNLEGFAKQHYPQMLQIFPPLQRVQEYARLIAFLRWARQPDHVAGIDFSELAGVPASSARFRTPDGIVKAP